jgi:hypothetical protein
MFFDVDDPLISEGSQDAVDVRDSQPEVSSDLDPGQRKV